MLVEYLLVFVVPLYLFEVDKDEDELLLITMEFTGILFVLIEWIIRSLYPRIIINSTIKKYMKIIMIGFDEEIA